MSQKDIDELPPDFALKFLQSLAAGGNFEPYCLFDADGVRRWLPHRGQAMPEKYPYTAFGAMPIIMGDIALFGPSGLQHWCIIAADSNAQRQGKEYERFARKVMTALLSMGVHAKDYGRSKLKPQGASAG